MFVDNQNDFSMKGLSFTTRIVANITVCMVADTVRQSYGEYSNPTSKD